MLVKEHNPVKSVNEITITKSVYSEFWVERLQGKSTVLVRVGRDSVHVGDFTSVLVNTKDFLFPFLRGDTVYLWCLSVRKAR